MISELKTCPFCKNKIPINSEVCPIPNCRMILIEKVQTTSNKTVSHQNYTTTNNSEPKLNTKTENEVKPNKTINHVKAKLYSSLLFLKRNKVLVAIGLLIFIIVFFMTLNVEDNPKRTLYTNEITNNLNEEKQTENSLNDNNSQIAEYEKLNKILPPFDNSNNQELIPELNTSSEESPEIYYDNGKIFEKNKHYFNGSGRLKIQNGTSNNAVAKLVNLATLRSAITVYIRRNSDLTIKRIENGIYRLFFVVSTHYNVSQNVFMKNCSFSVFEEPFNFVTYS
jgi:hypothetical protein